MSLTLQPAPSRILKNAISPGFFSPQTFGRLLRLAFITGPRLLLTSRISAKSASMMIMLSAPALILCGMLTIPALLFPSPQQQAYFYFSQILDHDPSRWIPLALASICTVIAMAVPALTSQPHTAVRY
ncbi:MAG: hypothetical protein ABI162_00895 [Luteolibacter sp.]